jgi:polysaccharide chain length determinant protein (PEP-CTERM system associated)
MEPKALLENLREHVRGAWRFRWIALAVAWVLCPLAWAAIFIVPDVYQASARVYVDTRTTLSEVTRGITVESSFDSQIERVRQALLGGPQLQQVAEEAGLMSSARSPREKQSELQKFRERIDISGGIYNQTAGTYVISFKDHDRNIALKVVNRLLNSFVEGTFGGKREGSQQAQKFLVDQIAEYERRLSEAEERLANFKKQNVGLMPGAQGDYFARMQKETEGLQQAQENLNVAERRRDELQRQLRGEQPVSTVASADNTSAPTASTLGGGDTAVRIRETQQRLDELLLRFTDKHPDIVALKSTLVELRERQQAEIEAARHGDLGAMARTGLAANPVYQNIQLQFNQTDVEIAALRAEIGDRDQKIKELKGLVNTAPEIEAELVRLNRDYDVTRAQYQALLDRLQRARLGEDADSSGIVRFQIIDPPTAGFTPVAPKRVPLIAAVLFLGIAAGAALAYLLHLLRPVFTSARQLHATTGLPVLGVVSMTWAEKYRLAKRAPLMGYAAATASLVLAAGIVLVTQGRIVRAVQGSSYESR